jgi:hypothetical protein
MRPFLSPIHYKPVPLSPTPQPSPEKVIREGQRKRGASSAPGTTTQRKEEQRPVPNGSGSGSSVKGAIKVAVVVAAFLLIGGGAGFGVWTYVAERGALRNKETEQIASNPDTGSGSVSPKPNSKPNPQGDKVDTSVGDPPDDDDARLKREEELRKAGLKKKSGSANPAGPATPQVQVERERPWGLTPDKVKEAISKGVAFLQKTQNTKTDPTGIPIGGWTNYFAVGAAAMGGLTLLESQVPPTDPVIQRAAALVRQAALKAPMKNYDSAVTILFLDRLGDPRDQAIITHLATRLVMSQQSDGGWTYDSDKSSPEDVVKMFYFLHSHRPVTYLNSLAPNTSQPNLPNTPKGEKSLLPSAKELLVLKGPLAPIPPAALGKLQNLPVVRFQGKAKGKIELGPGRSDNSNTQFAVLALWAARRHGVPTEQSLLVAQQHLHTTQNADGGWGYMPDHPSHAHSTPSMTCAGLLCEAVGHALVPEFQDPGQNNGKKVIRPAVQDPVVGRGLSFLGKAIGEPQRTDTKLPIANLYFLWSVERVALLYDLPRIEGKDWYGWGAQSLLKHQAADGSWPSAPFTGSDSHCNTCFALLFLQRINLARDLTDGLSLFSGVAK